MGKTKTKIIDDSVPAEESKKKSQKPKDELVEKLKAELGIEEQPSVISPQPASQQTTNQPTPENRQSKTSNQTPAKSKPRSQKYQDKLKELDRNAAYPLTQAVELAKKVSYSKFDGTLEAHLNTNIKNLRGLISLPFASGRKLTVLAFGKDAEEAGADIAGNEETLKEISKGKINFDVLVVTPEWMPKMASLAKILGPRGLMPNPKNGTITQNLKKTIAEIQTGKIEYKSEKLANAIHLGIGKLNQPTEELVQNAKVLLSTIGKSKIKKAVLSPTMGPGVKVDLGSI